MRDKSHLGQQIKMARKDRGFTSERLSELCNINAAYLRQIESGMKRPSLAVFIILCNQLAISPSYLLRDELNDYQLNEYEAVAKLWKNATPKQLKLELAMVETAVAILAE